MPTVEELLRRSLEERRTKPLQAVNDLKAVVTEVAEAVSKVTEDKVKVVLEPLMSKERAGPSFAISTWIADEGRVLRVVELAELGYPIRFFYSIEDWDIRHIYQNSTANAVGELREHVMSLLNGPQSELVRVIDNHLASLFPA